MNIDLSQLGSSSHEAVPNDANMVGWCTMLLHDLEDDDLQLTLEPANLLLEGSTDISRSRSSNSKENKKKDHKLQGHKSSKIIIRKLTNPAGPAFNTIVVGGSEQGAGDEHGAGQVGNPILAASGTRKAHSQQKHPAITETTNNSQPTDLGFSKSVPTHSHAR